MHFNFLILILFFLGIYGRPLAIDEEHQDYKEDELTKKVFQSIDANKDGGITFEEAMDAVEKGNKCFLGREHRLEEEFGEIDENGDGKVQLGEAEAAQNGTFHEAGRQPKALFKEIDTTPKDGQIELAEFVGYIARRMRLQEGQQEGVKRGFAKADEDRNGKLGLGEVLAMEEANKKGQKGFNQFAASMTVAAMQFDCQ